jgi:predicted Zn-dependent peptidase
VATTRVEEAIKAVCEELSKAKNKGVTDDEVTVAKKRLKTIISFRSENPEFLTEFYGRQEVYNQPIMTLEEYISRIEKVTKEEINLLLKKYLKTETLNLALVWNKPDNDKLLDLLKI